MAKQNTGVRFVAGSAAIWYGTRDSNGNILGNSATAPSAGATGSGLYRIPGLVSVNVPIPEASVVPAPGDDGVMVNFTFAPADLPTGSIQTAGRDRVFEALAQGTKVHTDGNRATSIVVPSLPTYAQLFLHILRQSQTGDETDYGNKKWQNIIYPNALVQPTFNVAETRAHAPFNYRVDLNKTNNLGTGETFTSTKHGTDLSAVYVVDTNYPYHHMRYIGDNTTTIFNLEYTPISTAEIFVFVNGVPATVSSVDTTLKTFTLSSAPATSAVVVAFYGFPESEL